MTASLQGSINIKTDSISVAVDRINDLQNKLKSITSATKAFEKAQSSYTSVVEGNSQALKEEIKAQQQYTSALKGSTSQTKSMENILAKAEAKIVSATSRIDKLKISINNNTQGLTKQKDLLLATDQILDEYKTSVNAAQGDVVELTKAKSQLDRMINEVNNSLKSNIAGYKLSNAQILQAESKVSSLQKKLLLSQNAIKNTTLSQADQSAQLKILQQRYDAAEKALMTYGTRSKQAIVATREFNLGLVQQSNALRNSLKGVGRGAGQAGIQVQQFVGQIQGGVDPMIALSQQSADLGWALGMPLAGAIAGIAFSMGTFLAPAMFDGKDATEELVEALDKLKGSSISVSGSTKTISDSILELAKTNFDLAQVESKLNLRDAEGGIKKSIKAIADTIGGLDTLDVAAFEKAKMQTEEFKQQLIEAGTAASARITPPEYMTAYAEGVRTLNNFSEQFGLSGEEAIKFGKDVASSYALIKEAPTPENIADFVTQLTNSRDSLKGLTKDGQETLTKLISIVEKAKGFGEVAEVMKKFGDSSKDALLDFANADVIKGMQDELKVLELSFGGNEEAAHKLETALAFGANSFEELSGSTQKLITDLYEMQKASEMNTKSIRSLGQIQAELASIESKRSAYLNSNNKVELESALANIQRQKTIDGLVTKVDTLQRKELDLLATSLGLSTADKTTVQLQKEVSAAYRERASSMSALEMASKSLFDLQQLGNTDLDTSTLSGLVQEYQNKGAEAATLFTQSIAGGLNTDEASAALDAALNKYGTEYASKYKAMMENVKSLTQMGGLNDIDQLKQDYELRAAELSRIFADEEDLLATHLAKLKTMYEQQSFLQSMEMSVNSVNGVLSGAMTALSAYGKEGTNTYKKMALTQATISQVLAQTKIWGTYGNQPWVAAGMAAASAAQFVGLIAQIKAQSYATGGYVSGAGTSTSDSIAARLSDGEYVIKAAAVRNVGVDYLDQINQGKVPMLYSSGGYVGKTSNSDTNSGNFWGNLTVKIVNEGSGEVEVTSTEQSFSEDGTPMLTAYINDTVRRGINDGVMDRSMTQNYGLNRKPRRR